MKFGRSVGFIILLIVILSIGGYVILSKNPPSFIKPYITSPTLTTVNGYLGWEKMGFFTDNQVKSIFKQKYNLDVQINKKGSIEMVTGSYSGLNYLFPSNNVALEIFKSRNNNKNVQSSTIFYSPIVIYSWKSLLPDLLNSGLVKQQDNYYVIDLKKLVGFIEQNKTWQDLGGKVLTGKVSISSTDPTKSSSGNLFLAIVSSVIANKDQVTIKDDLTPIFNERIGNFFNKMGLMDTSSGDFFDKFLNLGRSTYPLAVGYENQYIEVFNEKKLDISDVVPLYPNPTVWAEHQFIALDDNGIKLMQALQNDSDLKKVGWEKHGFRRTDEQVNTDIYKSQNIAKEIQYTIPLPKAEVMQQLIDYLSK